MGYRRTEITTKRTLNFGLSSSELKIFNHFFETNTVYSDNSINNYPVIEK